MTRKLQSTCPEEARSRKRVLKPVVEKKRRDRINQSLGELRRLLSSHTSDPRLQNPKIEKAEILDLAVEYLQKWTYGKDKSNDQKNHPPAVNLLHPESTAPALLTIESAGFQKCVAQLTTYMHRITPSQRLSLVEGLKHHTESQRPHNTTPDSIQKITDSEATKQTSSVDLICSTERREEPLKFVFQPHSCSTPCHDYLSPPPSPWLSPSFSTSPPFPSFDSHFSFPSSLSPLYSNTSFFNFSPSLSHSGPPAPPLITLRPPPHPTQREGSPPNCCSPMWRPWF